MRKTRDRLHLFPLGAGEDCALPGEGCVFTIDLPVARQVAARALPEPRVQVPRHNRRSLVAIGFRRGRRKGANAGTTI
jgi:hypothetical protein